MEPSLEQALRGMRKISGVAGFRCASNVKKSSGTLVFSAEPQEAPKYARTVALSRFKHLAHLLKQIINTNNVPPGLPYCPYEKQHARLKKLAKAYEDNRIFTPEDLVLYRAAVEFFSAAPAFLRVRLFGGVDKYGIKHDGILKRLVQMDQNDFQTLANAELYAYALSVLPALNAVTANWENYIRGIPGRPTSELLIGALGDLERHLKDEVSQCPLFRREKHSLEAHLNSSADDIVLGNYDCCIGGPEAPCREAALLYCMDSAMHTWVLKAKTKEGDKPSACGLVILTEAEGCSAANNTWQKYLVLEGFVSNEEYYHSKPKILNEGEKVLINGVSVGTRKLSGELGMLALRLGLVAAYTLGIPKLFVNTEHSGVKKSVEDCASVAAREAGLTQGVEWKVKGRRMCLLKDPLSHSSFAQVEVNGKSFPHTHFLRKSGFSEAMVAQVRKDVLWAGEHYFDTWFGWNKFIFENYASWPEEIREEHPYAAQTYARLTTLKVRRHHLESFWNLGIGYCTGIELDVTNKCAELGILTVPEPKITTPAPKITIPKNIEKQITIGGFERIGKYRIEMVGAGSIGTTLIKGVEPMWAHNYSKRSDVIKEEDLHIGAKPYTLPYIKENTPKPYWQEHARWQRGAGRRWQ